MMYYTTRSWTGSVLRSNDQAPYYGANKRSPSEVPHLNEPADHEIAADRPSLFALKGKEDAVVPYPCGERDADGHMYYRDKNRGGSRGSDNVSYDYGEGHYEGRMK
jgi:hypothetical protein